MSKKPITIVLLCCILCLSACVYQAPSIVGEPTPMPTPTPTLPPVEAIVTITDAHIDATGARIYDEQTHYSRYIAFTNMRVYEYEDGTFLDGVVENTYTEPLTGAFELVFRDKDDTVLARLTLDYTDTDPIPTGASSVYASIDTDMRIDTLAYTFTLIKSVQPIKTGN